ncbi:MAG: P-loop NTPase [Desulfobacterales bacterium]
MEKRNRSGDVEGRKVQRELQDREIKEKLHHIKNKILVMSGKGGVGKSSVAAYLSVAREFNKMVDGIVKLTETTEVLSTGSKKRPLSSNEERGGESSRVDRS